MKKKLSVIAVIILVLAICAVSYTHLGPYDGYAECVKVVFDEKCTSVTELMEHLSEIIDPYLSLIHI